MGRRAHPQSKPKRSSLLSTIYQNEKEAAEQKKDNNITKKKKSKKRTVVSKSAVSDSEDADSQCGKENITPGNKEEESENFECEAKKKRKRKSKSSSWLLGGSSCNGWSEEQDIALHNAYYSIKPVPTFWKEIAKMVPGKSSKECFNRFYSAFPTPPVSQPRSRILRKSCESPIRSFSHDFNTLLKSASSTGGRSGSTRQNILHAHKTVRQILRRHNNSDKEYETDIFSAVEILDSSAQSFRIPVTTIPVTPDCADECSRKLICDQKQSAHLPKSVFRFSSDSCWHPQNQLASPEVLKKVKNPALHDKYIDLLHSRDALRKASTQNSKAQIGSVPIGMVGLPQAEVVCAAKAAVVAEAQHVLQQAQTKGKKDRLCTEYCKNEDSEEECEENDDGEEI